MSTPAGVEGGGRATAVSRRTLRRIHRAGWALFCLWAAVLVACAIARPHPYAKGWRLVGELALVGRLVNVADGTATGFARSYLLFQSGLQDIILLLVVYPWVVSAYEGAVRRGLAARGIERVRRAAERHKRIVEPLGVLGLWAFVFFPFWSTGALVGGVVGYLLGMRTRVVFASVFAGHLLSVVSLIWFFDWVKGIARALHHGPVRYAPWIVLGGLLAAAFLGRLAVRVVRRGRGSG